MLFLLACNGFIIVIFKWIIILTTVSFNFQQGIQYSLHAQKLSGSSVIIKCINRSWDPKFEKCYCKSRASRNSLDLLFSVHYITARVYTYTTHTRAHTHDQSCLTFSFRAGGDFSAHSFPVKCLLGWRQFLPTYYIKSLPQTTTWHGWRYLSNNSYTDEKNMWLFCSSSPHFPIKVLLRCINPSQQQGPSSSFCWPSCSK